MNRILKQILAVVALVLLGLGCGKLYINNLRIKAATDINDKAIYALTQGKLNRADSLNQKSLILFNIIPLANSPAHKFRLALDSTKLLLRVANDRSDRELVLWMSTNRIDSLETQPEVNTTQHAVWQFYQDSLANIRQDRPHYTRMVRTIIVERQNALLAQQRQAKRLALVEKKRHLKLERQQKQQLRRQYEANREFYNGHEIITGPRGGRYYINGNGNRTYI